ncbi:MAG: 2Fe-2S iron-sulfur cluster binding domain-containing protein [Bacteroidales bacterium]|nr:2Fe-2S iron-sulfur cluster binding domain-containing protein [Bacteroidales bacterium]
MGGVNPYIQKVNVVKPVQPYTITYINEETNETVEFVVDPEKIPYGRTGLDGSILDIAEAAGVEIDHSCGGVCACATCHVYVTEGLETCPPATEDEEDMLDTARAVTPESRLSCQCVPNGTRNITVIVPAWNKNLVKEGH